MFALDELHQGRKYYRLKISNTVGALDKGVLIAKYLFSIGMNRYEIEAELYKKLNKVYLRIVSEPELYKKIKYMIDTAEDNMPKNNTITFNQAEIDLINSHEEPVNILLMTMMCVYKYYGGEFMISQMDIQKLSHIKINSAKFHNMFLKFLDMGYFNSYVKLERKFEGYRYNIYYKPSEELLDYTRRGSYVVMIDDFRNLWVRIRYILGYENNYYTCKDCGAMDIRKSKKRERCQDCVLESDRTQQENWKERTNWIHPNNKDSKYDYYYPSNKKQ